MKFQQRENRWRRQTGWLRFSLWKRGLNVTQTKLFSNYDSAKWLFKGSSTPSGDDYTHSEEGEKEGGEGIPELSKPDPIPLQKTLVCTLQKKRYLFNTLKV